MSRRNPDLASYPSDYLFFEIGRRKENYLLDNPEDKIISLGIGDTTEPLPETIVASFVSQAKDLGSQKYSGYGAALGNPRLRQMIADKLYQDRIHAEDVFISDGAKCDVGRLQLLFGASCTAAIQDPAYPVYVAANIISGKKSAIQYLSCIPENGFFPKLNEFPATDLIYLCSPNNPTGTAMTHEQLALAVRLAKERKSIILFDSAYSGFIRDPSLPKSIYEVDGAREVAIEIGSFSKLSGFTGVRLGWTVVPKELKFHDGSSVQSDWIKIMTTFFNGASNLSQAGGIACLTDEGLNASEKICNYYLENARILRETVISKGYRCFGGVNAPYLWVDMQNRKSWDVFDDLLERHQLVVTPGVGFGAAGEGFIRLSAFGKREQIVEAASRLKNAL